MAKSMKVPVLVFEDINEPSILLKGLHKILLETESISLEEARIEMLVKELKKIIKTMKKTNIR